MITPRLLRRQFFTPSVTLSALTSYFHVTIRCNVSSSLQTAILLTTVPFLQMKLPFVIEIIRHIQYLKHLNQSSQQQMDILHKGRYPLIIPPPKAYPRHINQLAINVFPLPGQGSGYSEFPQNVRTVLYRPLTPIFL